MRIAIISDAHNNLTNLKKVLDYCVKEKIEKIICCGDLASNESLDFLNNHFEGEIFYAIGNAEDGQLNLSDVIPAKAGIQKTKGVDSGSGMTYNYRRSKIYYDFGEAKIADKNVAFVHYPIEAKKLAESGKYDFVFYGHTHKPWIEKINSCTMLNPGNVAGEIYPPTFAVWNTENGKFELIRIHGLK